MWGGTAIATSFLVFRFYVRVKNFKKLFIDDHLVLLAWLFMLAVVITWQTQLPALYAQYAMAAGTMIPTPDFLEHEQTLLHSEVATVMFAYLSLWTVKFSFLMFFRRLSVGVQGQKAWWWIVFAFTVLTLASAIGCMGWGCTLGPLEYIFSECSTSLPSQD